MVKVTFTFDDDTVQTLRRTAARLKKPLSVVVREAIQEFATRSDQLSDEERRHALKTFDRLVSRIPAASQADAEAEKAVIRAARKSGGRRTRVE
jgi:hypothetical protein